MEGKFERKQRQADQINSSEKVLANHGDSLPTSINRIVLDCIIHMDQEKSRIESILDVMNIPEADREQYQYAHTSRYGDLAREFRNDHNHRGGYLRTGS